MSSSFEEWLSSAKRRYLEAKDLNEVQSLKDSVDKPYESKYKAKEVLQELARELSQFSTQFFTGDGVRHDLLIHLLLDYDIGSIDLDTEEIGSAQKRFEKCLNLFEDLTTDSKIDKTKAEISLTLFEIVVNNQLAYIWCSRNDFSKAEPYLKKAEKSYIAWDKSEDKLKKSLIDFLDVFTIDSLNGSQRSDESESRRLKNVESAHTLSLYLMAQVYEKMGDNANSAVYCHSTLKRQYRPMTDSDWHHFDPIDWSLNAATLSQYFAVNNDFDASRHHICCALKVITSSSDVDSDKYKKGLADLNRIVVKYSLMLLEASGTAIRNNEVSHTETNTEQTFRPYLLNDPEVEQLEKNLKTFPVITLTEAQQVFKYANNCLNEAIGFYTLEERASDYVECIQDRSKLYQYLIPFDVDLERQCKMHKRRIDCLEDVLRQISAEHFAGQCRQILFELAEICTQMAELKTHLMNEKPEEERIGAIKKINTLIRKAISYYDDFQKTFEEKSTNKMPEIYAEDYTRPILLSQFSIGRLYTKLICLDPRQQLKNWSKCEEYYTKVRDYLERNPQQKNHLEEELPLLEEMLKLIPQKMQNILNQTLY